MYGVARYLWLLAVVFTWSVDGSEFPERECCDLEFPAPTTPDTISASTTLPGPNTKTAIAILNCLLARQLCFEDASCAAILEIIPRVCGPELVACSTVTVTKCQAALRTLQAFPFFKPTCLCREPHVDPECSTFRDFLFDHPCLFVLKKEKDPYPVNALPTCNHALTVCQQEKKCISLYEDFKLNCKVRDNKCRMDDRNLCHEAWSNLRRSPMFGCICPNNYMKKRCDRIFNIVNHNPCVVEEKFVNPLRLPGLVGPGENDMISGPVTYNAHVSITRQVSYMRLTASENASASFDYGLGNSIIENPLVDAVNGYDAHADHDHISVSVLKNKGKTSSNHTATNYPEDVENGVSAQHQKYPTRLTESYQRPGQICCNYTNCSSDHGRHDTNEISKVVFQSTCHLAMESCNRNRNCRMSLAPILHHCDMSRCNRNSCMEALQGFYRKPGLPWNLDIAFCLCKKTDNKQDSCLVAQEKLHPVCAQRIEGQPQPTCISLAGVCRENEECRSRLELYEQSCAVDSVTKKCAGSAAECRAAMLGILGTDLRTNCACKGTDLTQIHKCLGWHRLLWVNPCVVESQKDFHMQKAMERVLQTTAVPTRSTTPLYHKSITGYTVGHITVMTATEASLQTKENTVAQYMPPPVFAPLTTATSTTTTTTTTTTMATTTVAPRYCVVQRPQFPDQYIREGTFKRIYHEDEFECSDVCECEIGEKLTCKTICIDRMPCKTEFAYYNHAAPAYQAYRGRCLCYSGRFICIKPSPNDIRLPQGIYLFLGYSEVDERELNKNQTRFAIQDVVRALQDFIAQEAINGTLCSLELFNTTKENVVIAGKLNDEVDYSMLSPMESLVKEKEECADLLEAVSDRINSRHPDFVSHLLLSIFKMAEVEVVQVEPSSVSHAFQITVNLIIFMLFINKAAWRVLSS